MYQYTQPAEGFEYREGNLVSPRGVAYEGKITRILPIAAAQAARCEDCGSAGCFMGTGPASIGCPLGREIPDIHRELEAAGRILKEAETLLGQIDNAQAKALLEELEQARSREDEDISTLIARYPVNVFDSLDASDAPEAQELRDAFNRRMKRAFEISYRSGPMGDIFARICPETLCQKGCTTRISGHGDIQIKLDEATTWDYAIDQKWYGPIVPLTDHSDKTVVVVGTGFAGYAVAERARTNGYRVVMIDKNAEPGEPGDAKIQPYKASIPRFRHHYDRLDQSGVEMISNKRVGRDSLSVLELKQQFKAAAIVFTTGTPYTSKMDIECEGPSVLIDWDQQLKALQRINASETLTLNDIPDAFSSKGKRVVIIGNGDTAVDSGCVAIIEGANELVMLSRTDKVRAESQDAAAYERMRKLCSQAGIPFRVIYNVLPVAISTSNGTSKMTLNKLGSGNAIIGQEIIEGDIFIKAIGTETGDQRAVFGLPNAPVHSGGKNDGAFAGVPVPRTIATKAHMMGDGATFVGDLEGCFILAAGQAVRGDSLAAVTARDGMDVQEWMHHALSDPERFRQEIEDISGEPVRQLELAQS